MFPAVFVLCIFVSVFNGGISHVPTFGSTHAVTADVTFAPTRVPSDESSSMSTHAVTADVTSVTTQAPTDGSSSTSTHAVTADATSVTTRAPTDESSSMSTHAVTADATSVTTRALTDESSSMSTHAVTADATSVTTRAPTEESLTRAVTEDAITHLTEFIQSVSPFSIVKNETRDSRSESFNNTYQGHLVVVNATRFVCGVYNPCGWMTYDRLTRRLKQWTQSTCDCREGTQCIKVDDNLSISSWEYRCRSIPSPPATEASQ